MKRRSITALFTLLALGIGSGIFGQTTAFKYQGSLQNSSAPANGNFDFEFLLFDAASGGTQVGSTLTRSSVAVAAGSFAVDLDFGSQFPGANRFLEIHVREAGGGAFTPLAPRQSVGSSPYSVQSLNAANALNATNATNSTNATNAVNAANFTGNLTGDVTGTQGATVVSKVGGQIAANVGSSTQTVTAATSNNTPNTLVKRDGSGNFIAGIITGNLTGNAATATNATQLGGVAASQYVLTGDARMTDARNPLPGSPNYIQNTNTAQAANFNVSGNGIVGGSLTATNLVSNGVSSFGSGSSSSPGVYAVSGSGNAVYGYSSSGSGLAGASGSNDAIYGEFSGDNSLKAAVRGVSTVNGFGVFGESPTNAGVRGISTSGFGILAESTSNYGVYGISGSSVGVVGGGATGVFGAATGPGKLGLRADGTSWFHGDTTPLSNALTGGGTGIAIGTTSTNIGYIFAIDYGTFTSQVLALNSPGGRVGIGTLAPDQTLSVNGNASKSGGGSWLTFSDRRLKNIKGRYAPGLAAVMRLQPLLYEYKNENALGIRSDGIHVGFSAQDVEQVIPEAVTKNEQGYRLVNNDPIMLAMLNAIKEQEAQIELLQKQIKRQNGAYRTQQAEIDALKKLVCSRKKHSLACR